MKIAYINQSYPPTISGAALVVQRLVEGIAKAGHEVMVLTASDRRITYSLKKNGIEIIRLRSYQNPFRVDHSFVLWNRIDIQQALTRFQPDILHLHDPLNIGLAGLLTAKKKNIPTILTIHQLPWFVSSYVGKTQFTRELVENSLWQYSNWFLGKCDYLITPSKTIAEIIKANTGFYPNVISNGVDLDLFQPHKGNQGETRELCRKYGLSPEYPVILYVGRIDPDKNVEKVIRSAAIVMEDIPAQLMVVGDGTQRDELIQLSKSLGIYEHCCFPGFVSRSDDLPGIYRLADVFVTASEIEIQSSVVLEAAASGVPVVTVDASSMAELVQEGVTGFLVQPGKISALSDCIHYLLRNRDVAVKMGEAGRKLVEQHSTNRFILDHELVYQNSMVESQILVN